MKDIHATIKEFKEYKLLVSEAEAHLAELEKELREALKDADTDTMTVGEYQMKLTTVTTQRVDTKALKTEKPEVYKEFAKSSTYERFTVK